MITLTLIFHNAFVYVFSKKDTHAKWAAVGKLNSILGAILNG